jgi:CspA family cold shock protein
MAGAMRIDMESSLSLFVDKHSGRRPRTSTVTARLCLPGIDNLDHRLCAVAMAATLRPERLDLVEPRGMEAGRLWRPTMARGTVKWFNSQKGYGFIQPQGGGKDIFVHISAVEKAGLAGLNEGQAIEYEEVSNRGKTSAENLKVHR